MRRLPTNPRTTATIVIGTAVAAVIAKSGLRESFRRRMTPPPLVSAEQIRQIRVGASLALSPHMTPTVHRSGDGRSISISVDAAAAGHEPRRTVRASWTFAKHHRQGWRVQTHDGTFRIGNDPELLALIDHLLRAAPNNMFDDTAPADRDLRARMSEAASGVRDSFTWTAWSPAEPLHKLTLNGNRLEFEWTRYLSGVRVGNRSVVRIDRDGDRFVCRDSWGAGVVDAGDDFLYSQLVKLFEEAKEALTVERDFQPA